jgi:hypothetical protein
VQIVEDKKDLEKEMMMLGDVSVEVPAGSTYAGLAENLKKGQKVSFSGKLVSIFGKTVFIKGSAKIALE